MNNLFICLFPAVVWSCAVLVGKITADQLGVLTACGIECLIGGTFLLYISRRRNEVMSMFAHGLLYYILGGGLWISHQILFFTAAFLAQSPQELAITGLINYTWPSLTIVIDCASRAQWRSLPRIMAGCMVGFIGIAIALLSKENFSFEIAGNWSTSYSVALLSALAWALYTSWSPKLAKDPGRNTSAIPLFMLFSALPLIGFGVILREPVNLRVFPVTILACWSIFSGFAYWIWDRGVNKGLANQLARAAMFIPVSSTVITLLLSQTTISPSFFIASLLVVLSTFTTKLRDNH
jgi:drug/metabolite transporter (DMT)-like permease